MKIYKITSPNTDMVYVGKTTRTLKVRFDEHRGAVKRYVKYGDRYCSSIKVLECGDAVIEVLEETDNHKREGYWIAELNACNQLKLNLLDKSDPVSVAKYMREYRVANKDAMTENNRKYREANRERILEHSRECSEYRNEKIGCDHCGRMVSRRNISTHKKSERCINNPLQINSL